MKKFVRARTDESKGIRRTAILAAAKAIVDNEGFPSVTVDAVAKKAKLGKSSLYVYFESREEILLALLAEDYAELFETLQRYLRKVERPFGENFVDFWVESISARPRLAAGMVYLHLFLEPYVSVDFAVRWKTLLRDRLKEFHYDLVTGFNPRVPAETLLGFMVGLSGVTIGLWSQSRSNEVVNAVYRRHPELKALHTDFEAQLRIVLTALLERGPYAELRKLRKAG